MAKPLDWSKTGTIVAMGSWLREKSDAICVVVIRAEDSAFLVDPRCAAVDAEELVGRYLPRLARDVEQARLDKRRGGRIELGKIVE